LAITALNSILGKYSGRHQGQQKGRRDDVRHINQSAGKEDTVVNSLYGSCARVHAVGVV
jgi:hypothetical protein